MVNYLLKMARICLMVCVAVIIVASSLFIMPSKTVYAIDNPDTTPSIEQIYAWRNVLETGDVFLMFLENTPYATTPTDYTYSESFLWRWRDGATLIGQAEGYDYDEEGFGYNVICFYLDATDAPAWSGNYTLRLSGKPSAFADPPQYNFDIPQSAYSALTDTDDVKEDIADTIIYLANLLYTRWGLTSSTSLVTETETATVLSLAGQTFFRGTCIGIQGIAPSAFPLTIADISVTDRTWTSAYTTNLTAQHDGSYVEDAFTAGEDFFDVDYNLLGVLITLALCLFLVVGNWLIAGGNLWKGFIECAPPLVIATRIGLFGLGELALVAVVCSLYVNARIWKLI